MDRFEKFCAKASENLDLSPSVSRSATRALLRFLDRQEDSPTAAEIVEAFGGLPSVALQPKPAKLSPQASFAQRVLQQAASKLGEEGTAVRLSDGLRSAGLPLEQLLPFVSAFEDFLREEGREEWVQSALAPEVGLQRSLVELGCALGYRQDGPAPDGSTSSRPWIGTRVIEDDLSRMS